MRTISEILSEITEAFHAGKFENPKQQAEELLGELLDYSRSDLYLHRHEAFPPQKIATCHEWLQRRLLGEPLVYLSGKIQFYGCTLEITPSVLIPRPETEILVDKIVSSLKNGSLKGKVLWDLCCGSGCIGIAIKKAFPTLTVYLSDQSQEALSLAQKNARRNAVDVVCLLGDLLSPFQGKKAHYIVCNPPYISEMEYQSLDREVKNFEPKEALVGGKTGLEFYERLAKELPSHLFPQAHIWLEIGYRQGEGVKKVFEKFPASKQLLENDWAGHPRFFFLENE